MKGLDFGGCALSCCVAAGLLSGCGGWQPPIGPSSISQKSTPNLEIGKRPPVMPTYKVSGPLLYVTNYDLTLTPLAIYLANADDPSRSLR